MSRPANCWRCGVDPSDWWLQDVSGRVWCAPCHSTALSVTAAIVNVGAVPALVATLAGIDKHVASEVERALAPRPGGEVCPHAFFIPVGEDGPCGCRVSETL